MIYTFGSPWRFQTHASEWKMRHTLRDSERRNAPNKCIGIFEFDSKRLPVASGFALFGNVPPLEGIKCKGYSVVLLKKVPCLDWIDSQSRAKAKLSESALQG